jgi:hypothetical protein
MRQFIRHIFTKDLGFVKLLCLPFLRGAEIILKILHHSTSYTVVRRIRGQGRRK